VIRPPVAGQQVRQSRLAGAAAADQRQRGPGRHDQVDSVEDGRATGVRVPDLGGSDPHRVLVAGALPEARGGRRHQEHPDGPGEGCLGALHVVEREQQGAQGREQPVEQQRRRGHRADRDQVRPDQPVPGQQNRRQADRLGRVHRLAEPQVGPRHPQTGGHIVLRGRSQPSGLELGHVVRVDGRPAVQRLEHDPAAFGGQTPFGGVEARGFGQVRPQAEPVDREDDQEGQCQPPVEYQEAGGRQHLGDQRDRGDEVLEILGDPRGHIAAAGPLEHRRGERQRPADDLFAQAGGDARAETFGRPQGPGSAESAGQDGHPEAEDQADRVRAAGAHRVDEAAEQERHDDGPGGGDCGPDQGAQAIVVPPSARRRATRPSATASSVTASTAVSGSRTTSTGGRAANARASATRCR
jgi:hypothetical protein